MSFLEAAQLNPPFCGTNDIVGDLIQVRIVGGDKVESPGRWPWACSFGYFESSVWKHKCGGSLISYEHVITAAHCIVAFEINKWKLNVRCGDFNLKDVKDDRNAQTRKVTDHHTYQKYKFRSKNNDIAILTVNDNFLPSEFVKPICLYAGVVRSSLIVIGWGSTVENDSKNTSDVLRASTQQKLDAKACTSTLTMFERQDYQNGAFGEDVFCAANPTGKQSGSCWGDSGGPIFSLNSEENRYELMGIVNAGGGCGHLDNPDTYTSAVHPPILHFIEKTVEGQAGESHWSEIIDKLGPSCPSLLISSSSQMISWSY